VQTTQDLAVLVRGGDNVATVTLNRPGELNALSDEVTSGLVAAYDADQLRA
jgi:enoyl-CoA hydratase/carnithine racemase